MNSPLRVYFVRHGESVANILHEFSNHGEKHPLTEKGAAQARILAAHLRERIAPGRSIAVFSSPLLRAKQTAQVVGAALGAPVRVDDALREYDTGVYEGRSDEEGWARYWQVRADWIERGLPGSKMEGGESLDEIRARALPFFDRLLARPPAEEVVLVSHGGLYFCVFPPLLGVSPAFYDAHGLGNTQFVLAEKRGEKLEVVEWCGERYVGG